jgi:ketosteroid isomerase-like protein
MKRTTIFLWMAVFVTIATVALLPAPCAFALDKSTADKSKDDIDRFNQKLIQLHLNMDHEGILALWADDGVDLMPETAPIVGKPAITAWLNGILANLKGYKVTKQEMEFHDIKISGDWASEWAMTRQVVQPPEGKSPIESFGKIALVLRRNARGEWKITQEMWNSNPRSSSPAEH